MSNYRELPPPPELSDYLACFWVQHMPPEAGDRQPRVVPDGCIDIVWIGEEEPHIAGPATRTIFPHIAPDTPIAGARFRPGSAPSLLGVPAGELRDLNVPLSDIWNPEQMEFAHRYEAPLSAPDMRSALESTLSARLRDAGPPDPLVREGVASLIGNPTLRVNDLSRFLDLSERQLRRRFEAAVGYGPKMLARILRMRTALRLMRAHEPATLDLAMVAYQTGYADQAHMTRELSRLAGAPPTRLLASPHAL